MNRIRRSARRLRADQSGLTLIELGISLLIVGLLMMGVIPAIESVSGVQAREAASKLTGMIRYMYNESALSGRPCRMTFDLDKREYWSECTQGNFALAAEREDARDGHAAADDKSRKADADRRANAPIPGDVFSEDDLAQAQAERERIEKEAEFESFTADEIEHTALPKGVDAAVWVDHQREKYTSGKAYLYFFPQGYTERAQIYISTGPTMYTLKVSPLTGKVKVEPKELELPQGHPLMRRPAAMRRASGFTLLEVMVAMAILAISLVALSDINAGAIAMHSYAKKLTVATFLAKSKMLEIESKLDSDGLPAEGDNISPDEGTFDDEGFPSYHWKAEVVAPKSDNLDPNRFLGMLLGGGDASGDGSGGPGGGDSSGPGGGDLAGMLGGLLGMGGDASKGGPAAAAGGAAGALGGLAGGMLTGPATMMITQITQMVREVRLTVTWANGANTESFTVVEHLVSMGPSTPPGGTSNSGARNPNPNPNQPQDLGGE